MNVTEIQQALSDIGWPISVDGKSGAQTKEAVSDFQRGYAFSELVIDGNPGTNTQNALQDSLSKGGNCSNFFAYREFASSGNGWIKVNRALVAALDVYRSNVNRPVRIVSGYRDPDQNAKAGGAKNSQHLYGNAADLEQIVSQHDVITMRLFSGIGTVGDSNGNVAHVDVRHDGPNTTGGSPNAPTLWYY